MSLTDDILNNLFNYHGTYRALRRRMLGYGDYSYQKFDPKEYYSKKGELKIVNSKPIKEIKENSLRVTLYRLRKIGLVSERNGIFCLTKEGTAKIKRKLGLKKVDKAKIRPYKMIIAFDIPEFKKKQRSFLRRELKSIGFKMIQKSLWVGPAPLPIGFVKFTKEIKVLRYLKFFEAKESEIV